MSGGAAAARATSAAPDGAVRRAAAHDAPDPASETPTHDANGASRLAFSAPSAASGTLPDDATRRGYFGGPAGPSADAEAAQVRARLGGGAPIDAPVRARMERGLGQSFGDVRLHTGSDAAAVARGLSAHAFAVGRHVGFVDGAYGPGTAHGDALLAHELAHTAQFAAGGSPAVARSADGDGLSAAPEPDAATSALEANAAAGARAAVGGAGYWHPAPATGVARVRRADDSTPMTALAPTYAGARLPTADVHGGYSQDLELDLDGDQAADTRVRVKPFDYDDLGRARQVEVELTRLDSSVRVVDSFIVPTGQSIEFSRVVHSLEPTDGEKPTRIAFYEARSLLGNDGSVLVLAPPVADKGQGVVEAAMEWRNAYSTDARSTDHRTFRFPLADPATGEVPAQRTVFHAGVPTRLGQLWTVDFTVGAFADPFRLTLFKDDPADDTVVLGFAPLVDGAPQFGSRFDLHGAPTKPLAVRVVSGSNLELALDLDGDGAADIRILDELTATFRSPKPLSYYVPPRDFAMNRRHGFRLGGGRGGGAKLMTYADIADGRFVAGLATEEYLEIVSQALAADSLPQQARTVGSYQDQLLGIDMARRTARQKAVPDLISQTFYDLWIGFADAVLERQLAGKPDTPAMRTTAAARARAFGAQISVLTTGMDTEVELVIGSMYSSIKTTNPYSGERFDKSPYRALSPLGSVTAKIRGTFAETAASQIEDGDWDGGIASYRAAADGLDRWIAARQREKTPDSKEAARLETLVKIDSRMQDIAEHKPTPAYAVFHPLQDYTQLDRINEIPLSLFYWKEDTFFSSYGEWHLRDLTNPDKVFTNSRVAGPETEPPPELFKGLNRRAHFVRGWIHYQLPSGTVGRVETTEKKETSDYFAMAAAALGAAALILATAGAASIVVTACIVAAGVAGATAAVLDMSEKSEQGILTTEDVVLDLLQVAASMLGGAGAVAREVKLAQQAVALAGEASEVSAATRVLSQWGGMARLYRPLTIATATADVATFVAYLPQHMAALNAIDQGPGDEADRMRAKALLLARFLGTGALTVLSVRGNWAELNALGSWEIAFVRGRPVARVPGGTYTAAHYAEELAVTLRGTAAEAAGAEVTVLKPKEFEARFASASGDAVTVFENGKPRLYVREGAVKSVVLEEAMHVQQIADPKLRPLVALVDEARLAKWPTMSAPEKLATLSAKLQLEIDAQRRVVAELSGRPSLSADEYAQLENAWQNIEHLRGKFADWATIEAEVKATQGIAGQPKLLDQPPRLFAKPTVESFPLLDTWTNMKPEEFLASYKARYPDSSLSDAELLQRFAAKKLLNPDSGRLVSVVRRAERQPDVKAKYTSDQPEVLSTEAVPAAGAKRLDLSNPQVKERDTLLKARDAARQERDALRAKIPPDEQAAGRAAYRVNEASRKLGELHAEAYMAQTHPDFEKVYPLPGAPSRSGDFDQVWQRVRVGPKGEKEYLLEHITVEAKGGSSPLGARETSTGVYAQQGTPEYFDSIVGVMSKGTPKMQETALALQAAGPDGVRYMHVKVPIEGDTVSAVTKTVVREFDLAPTAPKATP